MHPGDVFAINDPYLGGTHFNDVRIVRPIFHDGEVIAYAQSNGHWADVGGSVPGLVRHQRQGALRRGTADHRPSGSATGALPRRRRPDDRLQHARAERRRGRPARPGRGDTRRRAGDPAARRQVRPGHGDRPRSPRCRTTSSGSRASASRELPDGTWETEDYIDYDPSAGEGLIPVKVKLTIEGDQMHYDLSGSHPVSRHLPELLLRDDVLGRRRRHEDVLPGHPAQLGLLPRDPGRSRAAGNGRQRRLAGRRHRLLLRALREDHELDLRAVVEDCMPERAIACCFNLEYLLVGGRDTRRPERPIFMWYDWMVGGWGGRNGKDGSNATAPIFGVGLAVQPLEGQERLSPVVTTGHQILPDSGGPGRFRGGCGVEKGATLTDADGTVMSYCCDRARSITWGIERRAPVDSPRRVAEPRSPDERFLGAVFSDVPIVPGRYVHPPVGGRRRLRRSARARSGGRPRRRRRRLRHGRARAEGLRRRRPRARSRAVAVRARSRADRARARSHPPRAARLARRRTRHRSPRATAPASSTSSISSASTA